MVIGHEITHGFDDKGRQFDKDGNLKQWWNNATIQAFRQRTQCIIDQYSSYKLDDVGLNVNGRMTQGENIADNGGLKQSYRAYRKWVEKYGEESLLPGKLIQLLLGRKSIRSQAVWSDSNECNSEKFIVTGNYIYKWRVF